MRIRLDHVQTKQILTKNNYTNNKRLVDAVPDPLALRSC